MSTQALGISHVFITGVTSGIGRACMDDALRRGWVVSGCGRNQQKIDDIQRSYASSAYADALHIVQADVCDGASMRFAIDSACERFGPLRSCIANAGRGVDGELLEMDAADIAAVFDTNVLGVHRTVQAAKRYLAAGTSIVVVASVASFFSIPRMGAYCASKHALDAYVAALRMELHEENISVLSMCPGTVRTNFFDAAPKPGKVWNWRPGQALAPERVAKKIIDQAQTRGPRRVLMPMMARIATWIYWYTPAIAEYTMRRSLQKMRVHERSQAADDIDTDTEAHTDESSGSSRVSERDSNRKETESYTDSE